jgi:hypothetical protein
MPENRPVLAPPGELLNGPKMEALEYWRLCDELNIVQAALLVVGHDPSVDAEYIENWGVEKRRLGYEAAKTAISNALRRGKVAGTLVPLYEYDINGNTCGDIPESIDVTKSRIEVESLRNMAGRARVQNRIFLS